jgi:hypothetical protein
MKTTQEAATGNEGNPIKTGSSRVVGTTSNSPSNLTGASLHLHESGWKPRLPMDTTDALGLRRLAS